MMLLLTFRLIMQEIPIYFVCFFLAGLSFDIVHSIQFHKNNNYDGSLINIEPLINGLQPCIFNDEQN